MAIKAKFAGKCTVCGNSFSAGEEIEWSRDAGASHIECGEELTRVESTQQTYKVSCGSGYGGHEFYVGQVLRNKQGVGPEYLTVLASRQVYLREDGMSFGVGDEEGYIYSATCREATSNETAPVIAAEKRAVERKAAMQRLQEIAHMIEITGTKPEGDNHPKGTVLDMSSGGERLYGGGSWFVIGTDAIWYVRNNSRDGDCWAWNNVVPGGLGWNIPFTQALADEILTNHAIANHG